MEFQANYKATNMAEVEQSNRVVTRTVKWQPPNIVFYKLNTDAAFDVNSQRVGLGMIIRDHLGFVLGASAQTVVANFCPQIAEALAIFRGLTFVVESGLIPVVIESDALEVVNIINSSENVSPEIGLIV
ncbi:hypothetical protein Ddye_024466 [Dipteronia dyeriana]|uniref:RNase H type-1 domain-containing protein n=1 Tax=Dipteronia dyeriana TaxID=168575 RepID=A0AAD9TVI2_9ROSI|nr:hypothetical protein Ddye_024466 [Dipteronia dyeriana]